MKNGNLFVKGFVTGFKNFGHKVTNTINFILLLPVYFVGVGITSLTAKLSKKKFLDLDQKGQKTYWKERNLEKQPLENYYKQF